MVWVFGFSVEGLNLNIQGLGFGDYGSGFRVWDLGSVRCKGLVLSVYVFVRLKAQGLWFLVYGLCFRVSGFGSRMRI
jgi:hypothetical protein